MGLRDDAKRAARAQRLERTKAQAQELAAQVEREAPKRAQMQRHAVKLIRERLGIETTLEDWRRFYTEPGLTDTGPQVYYLIEAEIEGLTLKVDDGSHQYSIQACWPGGRFLCYVNNLADFGEALLKLQGQ